MYGNTNYQQMAGMNSVTKVQRAAYEEQNPGETYMDRAVGLFQRSGVGKFSISHYQARDSRTEQLIAA